MSAAPRAAVSMANVAMNGGVLNFVTIRTIHDPATHTDGDTDRQSSPIIPVDLKAITETSPASAITEPAEGRSNRR